MGAVISHGGKRETYGEFIDKFKPKKTTDDCITPVPVYNAVVDWVADEYGLDPATFVRPFWPGADYTSFEYPDGCVVVDNPPFSIMAKILRWYSEHNVRYFLFANGLTVLRSAPADGACAIPVGVTVTYDNGARVSTSFVTNLEQEYKLRTAPDLYKIIKGVEDERRADIVKHVPKFKYPTHLVTGAMGQQYSKWGVDYRVHVNDCIRVNALDSMADANKSIFGGGLLLSDKAAAANAAAANAAAANAAADTTDAIVWQLSERERGIIKGLGDTNAVQQV